MNYIINKNQKGFIKGRYIGENTGIVYVIIHETKSRHTKGLLLLIKFENAFDSISCSFIFKALQLLNFGLDIIKWGKTLCSDAKLYANQNGLF